MRSLQQIQEEINALINTSRQELNQMKKSQVNAIKRRIKYLCICRNYLEKFPREEFIKKQLELSEKKIETINDSYQHWLKNIPNLKQGSNYKSLFEKEMGLSKLRLQARTLRFLLN